MTDFDLYHAKDFLFEEGIWRIVKSGGEMSGIQYSLWDLRSWVWHHCFDGAWHRVINRLDYEEDVNLSNFHHHMKNILDAEDLRYGTCWWCQEVVPEHLMGLWKLQNLDLFASLDDADMPSWDLNDVKERSKVVEKRKVAWHEEKMEDPYGWKRIGQEEG